MPGQRSHVSAARPAVRAYPMYRAPLKVNAVVTCPTSSRSRAADAFTRICATSCFVRAVRSASRTLSRMFSAARDRQLLRKSCVSLSKRSPPLRVLLSGHDAANYQSYISPSPFAILWRVETQSNSYNFRTGLARNWFDLHTLPQMKIVASH